MNAPVVQTRYQNTTVPCETLFVRQGYFDIFFPTNFENLRDMYEHVLADPTARVVRVVNKNTKKWKPLPLTTVDLQKAGSRLLKISPKKVLDVRLTFLFPVFEFVVVRKGSD